MYCPVCGSDNNKNSKYCSKCGNVLENINGETTSIDKADSLKAFSIVAFIFSIILFPVGIILSIIGYVRCKKYENETDSKIACKTFNIVGIIVSIVELFIVSVILVILFFVYGIISSHSDKILGKYNCYITQYSKVPVVSASFKNGEFYWAKYNDEKNNIIRGKYFINKIKINNDNYQYELWLTPKYYKADNIGRLKRKYRVNINGRDNAFNIKFENSLTYYCSKIGE